MIAAEQLAEDVGVRQACEALGIPRASFYRRHKPPESARDDAPTARSSSRALSEPERDIVRQTLYSERFMDQSPQQVYASLLDDGEYLCSVRTMYRILDEDILDGVAIIEILRIRDGAIVPEVRSHT